ncbi:MAG: hypothetical protein DMD91_15945 [Candidatus Rokuibacteriota bacterium]|nr:MAG: hypothetical protein DMD91_15945 [Candidatus Rokubacteria bacterium]
MSRCRFLPLLILVCALDLAMPVAPTPIGVEFEDDEEVVHLKGWRLSRPSEVANPREVAPVPRATIERVGAVATPRAAVVAHPTHAPRVRLVADPPLAPSAAGEDH